MTRHRCERQAHGRRAAHRQRAARLCAPGHFGRPLAVIQASMGQDAIRRDGPYPGRFEHRRTARVLRSGPSHADFRTATARRRCGESTVLVSNVPDTAKWTIGGEQQVVGGGGFWPSIGGDFGLSRFRVLDGKGRPQNRQPAATAPLGSRTTRRLVPARAQPATSRGGASSVCAKPGNPIVPIQRFARARRAKRGGRTRNGGPSSPPGVPNPDAKG